MLRADEVATKLGLSTSTLRRYRDGSRGIPSTVVRRLSGVLRHHAKRLNRLADRLDESRNEEDTR